MKLPGFSLLDKKRCAAISKLTFFTEFSCSDIVLALVKKISGDNKALFHIFYGNFNFPPTFDFNEPSDSTVQYSTVQYSTVQI